MAQSKQATLFDYFGKSDLGRRYGRTAYGGAKPKGRRKLERPLATNRSIHLVLKSDKAVGYYSFLSLRNRQPVESLLRKKAKQFGVFIAELVNVGNHLHLKIRIADRHQFQKFLKSVTCLIARMVTGAKKGKPFGRFWQHLAYTRVLKSSLEELYLKGYLEANRREASQSFQARQDYLKKFNDWVRRERKASFAGTG